MFELSWYVVFSAYVLDFIVKDPVWMPHPVVWMGHAISYFEPKFRKIFGSPFKAGLFFAIFLILMTWCLSWVLISCCQQVHPVLGEVVKAVLLFFCLSAASLEQAAMKVSDALKSGDIQKARYAISMIVGRQTDTLDAPAITRAGIETVAENFVDGFLSPLFFALIGGVPLAMAYKMVNTLDSMVGYRNEKYIFFGRVSARIDDIANYIPARLSVLIISACAMLIPAQKGFRAFYTAVTQGRRHKSPNSGFSEAAFSGALGVRLGGPNMYHGVMVEKPYIGEGFGDPEKGGIKQASDLMILSAFCSILISSFILLIIQVMLSPK